MSITMGSGENVDIITAVVAIGAADVVDPAAIHPAVIMANEAKAARQLNLK